MLAISCDNCFIVGASVFAWVFFDVVYEEPRFEDDVFDTLLNPIILVEGLSPATEVYDQHEKFAQLPKESLLKSA